MYAPQCSRKKHLMLVRIRKITFSIFLPILAVTHHQEKGEFHFQALDTYHGGQAGRFDCHNRLSRSIDYHGQCFVTVASNTQRPAVSAALLYDLSGQIVVRMFCSEWLGWCLLGTVSATCLCIDILRILCT